MGVGGLRAHCVGAACKQRRRTGLSLPLRRSMASIAVSGTPLASHSVGWRVSRCRHAIIPVAPTAINAAAVRPKP